VDDDALRDLFESLPDVSIRRLFGGKGIYADGVIVAVVIRDELRLKADAETAPLFEKAGATQWVYTRSRGGQTSMPYWSVPETALDDPDEMAKWAKLAYEAGMRAER
jgi:DNA transformation protein